MRSLRFFESVELVGPGPESGVVFPRRTPHRPKGARGQLVAASNLTSVAPHGHPNRALSGAALEVHDEHLRSAPRACPDVERLSLVELVKRSQHVARFFE